MDEWPEGWFRGEQREGGAANSDDNGAGGTDQSVDRTVSIPATNAAGQYQVGQYSADGLGWGGPARAAPPGGWPAQPPVTSRSGQGSLSTSPRSPSRTGGPILAGSTRWRRWLRPKRIFAIIAAVIVVVLLFTVGTYFYLNSQLTRVNALVPTSNLSAGSNWLISGAPGQVTRRQSRQLGTGPSLDANSDTILLLHLPANGGSPILVSIPRDSYVPIPGHGMDKINAAYTFGGGRLLVQTVQNVTGLKINHYLNIGYLGLVNAVNAVGGVRICLPRALNDQASGVHLPKGCDTLNGKEALAFVRTRHQFLTQDLQREQNQRVFIKALISKMLSPSTLLNPFALIPAAVGSASALTVDQGTQLNQLISVAFALRHPETTTVPIANANYFTPAGDAVQLNSAQARQLFNALRTDSKVPKYLITGSRLA